MSLAPRLSFLLAAAIVGASVLVFPVLAVALEIADGGIHVINAASPSLEVRNGMGGPTTINVVDGAYIGFSSDLNLDPDEWSVSLFEDSIFNMSGGSTWTADDVPEGDGKIYATDNAVVTITGGVQGESITGDGNAVISITNGDVRDDLEALGSSLMNVYSGNMNEDVEAEDSAVINIFGGTFGTGFEDGGQVTAEAGGTINVFGGSFTGPFDELDDEEVLYDIQALDGGFVNIHGGLFQPGPDGILQLYAQQLSVVTIYGKNFEVNGSPVGPGPIGDVGGILTGILADGTPLNVHNFVREFLPVNEAGQIVLVQVPEPSTVGLGLFALGGALGWGRRRR